MSRFFNVVAVVVVTTLLTPFQNCSPLQSTLDLESQDSNVMGFPLSDLSAKFATTLQPTLTTNCGSCHVQLQSPMFAVSNADSAVLTIAGNNLVDLRTPANSRFVIKLNGGHSGFSAAMGTQVQNGIQAWATAMGIGVADIEAPAVMISSPAASASVSGTISVQAVATDNIGVVGVQFLVDGINSGGEDLSSPYSLSLNTSSLANGSHNLSARARDAAGNVTTAAVVSITVSNVASDVTAPTVSITSPAAAATLSGTINITANAADNIGVVGVQFLVDGVASGGEDLAAPYSVSLNTTSLTNGSHNISARARDAAGNMTTSAVVAVTVSNVSADITAPTVSVTSPAAAATISGTINMTANAADNIGVVGVQFLVDGVASGGEDLAAPYSVSLNTTSLTNGSHNISARARDAAGNMTTSAVIAVTISNGPNMATYTYISTNLLSQCLGCHGATLARAGYRFDTYARTLNSVVANNAAASILYTTITTGKMSGGGYPQFTAPQEKAIFDWINAGALNN